MNIEQSLFIPLFIGFLLVILYFESKNRRSGQRPAKLVDVWKKAREQRLAWKKEHATDVNFNFYDPEYQRLWNIEIGAEDYHILCNGLEKITVGVSWGDYIAERNEYSKQD